MYSTLVPSGLMMLAKFTDSPSLGEWIYDMEKILDFVYVPKEERQIVHIRFDCRLRPPL